MYVEDLEWCWRASKRGWTIRFEPAARVVHVGNVSGAQALRRPTDQGLHEEHVPLLPGRARPRVRGRVSERSTSWARPADTCERGGAATPAPWPTGGASWARICPHDDVEAPPRRARPPLLVAGGAPRGRAVSRRPHVVPRASGTPGRDHHRHRRAAGSVGGRRHDDPEAQHICPPAPLARRGYGEAETFGARALPTLLRVRGFDLVHAFTPTAAIAARLAGHRTLYTVLGHPVARARRSACRARAGSSAGPFARLRWSRPSARRPPARPRKRSAVRRRCFRRA